MTALPSHDFRLVPIQPQNASWLRSWRITDTEGAAVRQACDFFARNGVPVMVRRLNDCGVAVETVGVYSDRKLRSDRGWGRR